MDLFIFTMLFPYGWEIDAQRITARFALQGGARFFVEGRLVVDIHGKIEYCQVYKVTISLSRPPGAIPAGFLLARNKPEGLRENG